MEGIRAKAEEILEKVRKKCPIYSKPKGDNSYYTYTGYNHDIDLQPNWNAGGYKTGCNAFVGWYCRAIGSPVYLGGFDFEGPLRKIGKQHAWVRPSSGYQPRYGDMCLHGGVDKKGNPVLHASVSLGVDKGNWDRLNAGQGGPKMGADIIAVSSGPWSPALLKGWVDIESLIPAPQPPPGWIQGWWQVTFRGDTYYYYMDLKYQAKWSEVKPWDLMGPMLSTDGGTGAYSVTNRGEVTLRWRSGTVEKFQRDMYSSGEAMRGTGSGGDPISAEKMD
jgi:hypothetical protein